MKAKKLRTAINMGLVVMLFGVLLTFPFKEDVLGGLLFAIFCAALIGGLADSFAVKAIFGHPLRIKWPSWLGTNIVDRHRDRLVNELVKMVQDELLSPSAIRLAFKDRQLSLILQNFLVSEIGQRTVNQLLTGAIKETVNGKNISILMISLKRMVTQLSSKSRPSSQLSTILAYIFKECIDDTVVSFVVKMVSPLLQNIELRSFVKQVIQTAIAKYEKDNRRRQVANQMANIDANQLTEKLFDYVDQWLFDVMDNDHPLRQKIKQQSLAFMMKIDEDVVYASLIDDKINQLVISLFGSLTKGKVLHDYIEKIEQALAEEDETHIAVRWSHSLTAKIQQLVIHASFEKYDELILDWVLQFIENKQHMIGNLVQEKMNQYSTADLITLVEDKAGRDLQFIRMNGAVVGGLIGGVLYIVQLLIGGAI